MGGSPIEKMQAYQFIYFHHGILPCDAAMSLPWSMTGPEASWTIYIILSTRSKCSGGIPSEKFRHATPIFRYARLFGPGVL